MSIIDKFKGALGFNSQTVSETPTYGSMKTSQSSNAPPEEIPAFPTTSSNPTENDLLKYEADVRLFIRKKLDMVFGNWSNAHAKIILNSMIQFAPIGGEVLLYERDLSGDLSGKGCSSKSKFVTILESFVGNGGTFKVVVKELKDENKGTEIYTSLKTLCTSYPNQVFVYLDYKGKFESSTKEKLGKKSYFGVSNNFIRIEEKRDDHSYEAICNVNSPQNAKILKDIFNNNLHETTPIFANLY